MDKIVEKTKITEDKFSLETFDYTKRYSDEFYQNYMNGFVPNIKRQRVYRVTKRILDIIIAVLGLIILSPVMLVIAIAIKCDSKGPVIFKQKRIGQNGQVFNLYKFRSMKITAPRECATSVLKDPECHLTRVGKVIRKLSLDELPQLWCVLVGTMSVIGYRPLILSEVNCNEMRRRLGVFKAKPGISGYAQVVGRDDVYYKNKAVLDAEYVKTASLGKDIELFFRTFAVVLFKKGNRDDRDNKRSK